MKFYAMCGDCGRSVAVAHGRCQRCLRNRLPQRRVAAKVTTPKKLR